MKKAVSLQRFREIKRTKNKFKGRLAQLVQSICLTSRGSAVRIRQRPQKMDKKVPCNIYCEAFLFSYLFYINFLSSLCIINQEKELILQTDNYLNDIWNLIY